MTKKYNLKTNVGLSEKYNDDVAFLHESRIEDHKRTVLSIRRCPVNIYKEYIDNNCRLSYTLLVKKKAHLPPRLVKELENMLDQEFGSEKVTLTATSPNFILLLGHKYHGRTY